MPPPGDLMEKNQSNDAQPERRSEPRATDTEYYSVQFTPEGLGVSYQFKLWNISQSGMCILVRDNSQLLEYLSVGDIFQMTFHRTGSDGKSDKVKTTIKHITPNAEGRFSGHCLVGLAVK